MRKSAKFNHCRLFVAMETSGLLRSKTSQNLSVSSASTNMLSQIVARERVYPVTDKDVAAQIGVDSLQCMFNFMSFNPMLILTLKNVPMHGVHKCELDIVLQHS